MQCWVPAFAGTNGESGHDGCQVPTNGMQKRPGMGPAAITLS
jgi:hypothetical protein